MANVLIHTGENAKAMELLERAVQLDPTAVTAHYELSSLYRQQGRSADAKQQLDEFLHYRELKSKLKTSMIEDMRMGKTGSGSDLPQGKWLRAPPDPSRFTCGTEPVEKMT